MPVKIAEKKDGFYIGILTMLLCFALAFTYIVPILSTMPGAIVEEIAAKFTNNNPYSNVARLTLVLLVLLFIVSLVLCLLWTRRSVTIKGNLSRRRIIAVMLLMYFPVHMLAFYIYWGLSKNFTGDGQLIMGSFISFPLGASLFMPIGALVDVVKNSKSHVQR